MCSVSDVLCDTRHATFAELDVPPPDTLRPTTPLPDRSRTLRRTISYASIDTVRAPSPKNKGVRRSINEIAGNLKQKSEKKKKKCSSTRDVPKNVVLDPTSEPKAELQRKAAKRERKAPSPLQDASHGSEEDSVLAIADRLHRDVFSELDSPPTFLGWKPNTVAGVLLLKDGEVWEDYNLPAGTLEPEAHVTAGTPRHPSISTNC
ncbi:hypothetical protein HD554DRAFT_2040363 [Boletus coccyginus]|nr:hypothetical protein HD554DRAFT_2040363 [Boletus coccyginus]